MESWTISRQEVNLLIESAKKQLEIFQPIDMCSSYDDFSAAFLADYDFLFQDFINNKVVYLAGFFEKSSQCRQFYKL